MPTTLLTKTPRPHRANVLRPGALRRGGALRFLRISALCLGGVGAFGCEVQDGFMSFGDEFFDPGVQYFNVPGTRIAEGRYGDLRVQVATDGQRYVAALKDFSELTLSYFDETPQCSLGPVVDFGNAYPPFSEGDEGEELLPYLTRDEASGIDTLHFSNRRCEDVDLTIENARLPLAVLDDAGPDKTRGFLTRTSDDRLVFAAPWHDAQHEIGTGVSQLKLERDNLFTVENGELVVRDRGLAELGRLGPGVLDFELNPERTEITYNEGTKLYSVPVAELDSPVLLEDDACQFQYGLGGEETRLSYLSPCESGRLVITDATGERRIEYVEGVANPPRYLLDEEGHLRVVYVTGGAEERPTEGTLWLRVDDDEPVMLHEKADISTVSLVGDDVSFIADIGETGGTYVRWSDGDLTEIAEDVVEISGNGILANFDGSTGDLLKLNEDATTELLGEGVPVRARRGDAFIANFDGTVGDLMWLEDGEPPAVEIGSGVGKSAFGFGVQFEAVIYLKDRAPEDGTSTLTIRLIETGDVFEIRTGVSESREVAFPRPGILYSVLVGEEPGIWFAHAR